MRARTLPGGQADKAGAEQIVVGGCGGRVVRMARRGDTQQGGAGRRR